MDNKLRELISKLNILSGSFQSKKSAASSGGSHQVALTQSSQDGEDLTEYLLSMSSEYQLTVKIKAMLTRRQIGLLLEVLNYQSVYFGVNLGMYLALEHLVSLLIGQKTNPFEIKDEIERRCTSVSYIILQSLGDQALSVLGQTLLPDSITQKLIEEKLIMSRRTFGSRFQKWRPENWLEIKTVPLSIRFDREKGTSERYSSYCKGYGESHPSAHYKKTKPSSELDGETEDKEYVKLSQIPNLLILVQLEYRAKFLRMHRKS